MKIPSSTVFAILMGKTFANVIFKRIRTVQILFSLLLIYSIPSFAEIIAICGFDATDNMGYETTIAPAADAGAWRTTTSPVLSSTGSWVATNLDGAATTGRDAQLTFTTVTVTGYSNVVVAMRVNTNQGGFESSDYMRGEVLVDGGSWVVFFSTADPDGILTWTTYYYNVPAGANTVCLRWTANNNAAAESFYLDDVTITGVFTADTIPPAAISNLTALAGTDDGEIKLEWTAPGNDGTSGNIGPGGQYHIKYSTANVSDFDSPPYPYYEIYVPTQTVPGTTHTYIITGLNPGTTYYFAIKTKDPVDNWSSWSTVGVNTANFAPGQDLKPGQPTWFGAGAYPINTTTVDLKWNSVSPPTYVNDYDYYRIECDSTPPNDFGDVFVVANILYPGTTHQHTGLDPNTTYYYRIALLDKGDQGGGLVSPVLWSDFSLIVSTRPQIGAPASPSWNADRIFAVSTYSIHWCWYDNSSNEQGFRVYSATGGQVSPDLLPGTTWWLWSDLQSNTTYSVYVVAYNLGGESSAGTTTYATLASPPTYFAVTAVSSTTASLSWSLSDATKYQLQRTSISVSGPWSVAAVFTNSTTHYDTGLKWSTTYWYRIGVLNKDNVLNTQNYSVTVTTITNTPVMGSPIRINELATDETNGLDWIEFYVAQTGNYSGYKVYAYISSSFKLMKTFPAFGGNLTRGEYVLLRVSTYPAPPDDTTGTGGDGIWNLYVDTTSIDSSSGLVSTDNVVYIKDSSDANIVDAVCISNLDTTFVSALQTAYNSAISSGQWAGPLATGANDAEVENACADWSSGGAGKSIGRDNYSTDTDGYATPKNEWYLFTGSSVTPGAQNPPPPPPPAGKLYGYITEVAPNITGGDFIEIFITADSNVNGVKLYEGGALNKVFPNLTVSKGNYIVVDCSNSGTDETDATGDTNGNGYWDLYSNNPLQGTDNNITILNADGTYVDFMGFANGDSNYTGNKTWYNNAVSKGHWSPSASNEAEYEAGSIAWSGSTSNSMSRKKAGNGVPIDTNTKGDWEEGATTKGSGGYSIPDFDPPANISALTALAGSFDGEVKLNWVSPGDDYNSGALNNASYRIKYSTISFSYFSSTETYSVMFSTSGVNPGTAVSYIVTGLYAGTTYYFAIIACDDSGNWSKWIKDAQTNTSNFAPAQDLVPSPPTPSVESRNREINLSWSHPSPDPGDIDKYWVYQATFSFNNLTDGNVVHIATVSYPLTQYTVTGLKNGTTYYFRMKSIDNGNGPAGSGLVSIAYESYLSFVVFVMPRIRPPSNLVATHKGTSISLSWAHSLDFGADNFAGYNIYRSEVGEGGPYSLVVYLSTPAPESYSDTNSIDPTKTYYYFIRSSDTAGPESINSNIATALPDLIPPEFVEVTELTSRSLGKKIATINIRITDDRFKVGDKQGKIKSITGKYRKVNSSDEKNITITGSGWDTSNWIGTGELDFSVFVIGGDGIEYYLEAKDEVRTTRWPSEGKWWQVVPPADKPEQKFITPSNLELVFGKDVEEVIIRDAKGNEIWKDKSDGGKIIIWHGDDRSGKKVELGPYIYEMRTKDGKKKYGVVIIIK